jgi:hypothetical protein|uniref:Uncharacterized protein n=1 Tax=Myoviridae sp. ctshb19 TaxID=2825194 RepID=A0A8S5UH40_9CAUD|nr:MAG TPA: hypothetical protein [Myoviridae sp. ctshb19]
MQTGKMELMAQQVVLAFLGFYNGAIDGIWSGASMKAKRDFECADAYVPGIPSNGLPFSLTDRLPKGLYWEKKVLNHRNLTPEKAQEIINNRKRTVVQPVVPPVEPELEDDEDFSDDDAQE